MKKILQSKIAALFLLALIVAAIILTFRVRSEWWMFIDLFFAFMMAFNHLMALTLGKFSVKAAKMLDTIALVCGILFVIAIIVLFFLMEY